MKHLKTYEKLYGIDIVDDLLDDIQFDSKGVMNKINKLYNEDPDIIDRHGSDGSTPLIKAVFYERDKIVKMLIKLGVDINKKDYYAHTTPLMVAGEVDSWDILVILCDAGADWNIKDDVKKDFFSYCTEEYAERLIEDYPEKYPEKYQEYLLKKDTEKYNL